MAKAKQLRRVACICLAALALSLIPASARAFDTNGIPQELQETVQKVLASRARDLPERVVKLSVDALRAYYRASKPARVDQDWLRKVMREVDATAFIPDVEAMISVCESESRRSRLQERIDKIKRSEHMNYDEMREILNIFELDGFREALAGYDPVSTLYAKDMRFPAGLRFPVLHKEGHSKGELVRALIHNTSPEEILPAGKSVPLPRLSTPSRFAAHDSDHYGSATYLDAKTVEESLQQELTRVGILDEATRLGGPGTDDYLFDLVHESTAQMVALLADLKNLEPEFRGVRIRLALVTALNKTDEPDKLHSEQQIQWLLEAAGSKSAIIRLRALTTFSGIREGVSQKATGAIAEARRDIAERIRESPSIQELIATSVADASNRSLQQRAMEQLGALEGETLARHPEVYDGIAEALVRSNNDSLHLLYCLMKEPVAFDRVIAKYPAVLEHLTGLLSAPEPGPTLVSAIRYVAENRGHFTADQVALARSSLGSRGIHFGPGGSTCDIKGIARRASGGGKGGPAPAH